MKNRLSILVALIMVAALLASCGPKATPTPVATEPPVEATEVVVTYPLHQNTSR